jgi:DNA-binding PadR family transcriptional regulator
MHPYEMSSVMRERGLSTVIKLSQSSLYSIIETLHQERWIVPVETQREGRYPERTIYTTTEAGQAELIAWLRSLIRQPATEYTQFAAGLAFLGHLSPTEAATLLEEHSHYLQEQISDIRSTIEKALQLGVDRLFLVEDSYILTLLEAKLSFVQQLIQEINNGTLTETRAEQLTWKILRPDLSSLGSEEQEAHE